MNTYFAYGSNLSLEQIKERCPDSKLIGKAVLKDFSLDFTIYSPRWKGGCADIIKKEGSEVWGLLFSLSDDDLKKLDHFEGIPKYYSRIDVSVFDDKGKSFNAVSYEVTDKAPFIPPVAIYIDIIKKAARIFEFPQWYIEMLDNVEVNNN